MAGEPVILNNRKIPSPGYRFGVDILICCACLGFWLLRCVFWLL
jgi:hypothetical protein